MFRSRKFFNVYLSLLILSIAFSAAPAQKKSKKPAPKGQKVMWEPINIPRQDLYLGPGGEQMRPDLSRITFIKKESGGMSTKFRIRDGAGRVWVAKIGKEAQPETAAVRLLSGLGYKTEINYLVPSLTIPTKGTFRNVRLEARPEHIERLDRWRWKNNPFKNTPEFQGLKIMMAFINNWDIKDGNNLVLYDKNRKKLYYVNSDLGATFGKYGSNNLPLIWRIGRSVNKPSAFHNSKFIDGVKKGRVDFAFKGKKSGMFKDITVAQARWLTDLLLQLSDKQIEDAFRAANYSAEEVRLLSDAVRNRIAELERVTNQNNLAENRR